MIYAQVALVMLLLGFYSILVIYKKKKNSVDMTI